MKTLFPDFDGLLHPDLAPEEALLVRAPALDAAIAGFPPGCASLPARLPVPPARMTIACIGPLPRE